MVKKTKKKPREFFKTITVFSFVFGILAVITSYTWAWFQKDTVSNVTLEIFATCMVPVVAYSIKSFLEKNSRNKYMVDENGIPRRDKDGILERTEIEGADEK